MSTAEDYRPCRACGALCDGDVCDATCENLAWEQLYATRAEQGLCLNCGVPSARESCPECVEDDV